MGFPLLKDICILCLVLPPRLQSDCCNPLQHVRLIIQVDTTAARSHQRGRLIQRLNLKSPARVPAARVCMFITWIHLHPFICLGWKACLPACSHRQHWEQKPPQSAPQLISFTFSLTNTTLDYKPSAVGAESHVLLYVFYLRAVPSVHLVYFVTNSAQTRGQRQIVFFRAGDDDGSASWWRILQLEDRHTHDLPAREASLNTGLLANDCKDLVSITKRLACANVSRRYEKIQNNWLFMYIFKNFFLI